MKKNTKRNELIVTREILDLFRKNYIISFIICECYLSRTKRIFNVPFKSSNGNYIVERKKICFFSAPFISVFRFCSISRSKYYYYQIKAKHSCYSNELAYVHLMFFFTKNETATISEIISSY